MIPQYRTLKSKLPKYRLKNMFGAFLDRLEEVKVLVVRNHHNQVILSSVSERDTNPCLCHFAPYADGQLVAEKKGILTKSSFLDSFLAS